MLLSFFEQYGNSVILSVDDLRQIRAKDNENFYYIGKFVLRENEKNTVLIDYIIELVRGFLLLWRYIFRQIIRMLHMRLLTMLYSS